MKKIFINLFLISIMLAVLVYFLNENKKENIIKNENIKLLMYESNLYKAKEEIVKVEKYSKEKIADTYKGYKVCAKLVIPAISLETNVLENFSEDALKVSVVKFWGADPNQKGNFCIAGHNFRNKNMFKKLKNLKIGDKLSISDRKVGKVEYQIFKIDTVLPDNIECLNAQTINEREVTLITCTLDSKKRIILKAKEV